MGWPEPGSVITFAMWDLRLGRARFVGIGKVTGVPQQHPRLDVLRLPIQALEGASGPVPAWIRESDIIDVLP